LSKNDRPDGARRKPSQAVAHRGRRRVAALALAVLTRERGSAHPYARARACTSGPAAVYLRVAPSRCGAPKSSTERTSSRKRGRPPWIRADANANPVAATLIPNTIGPESASPDPLVPGAYSLTPPSPRTPTRGFGAVQVAAARFRQRSLRPTGQPGSVAPGVSYPRA